MFHKILSTTYLSFIYSYIRNCMFSFLIVKLKNTIIMGKNKSCIVLNKKEDFFMTKVAVVFADGCEEVEGLSVVDVLRRLDIDCDMVGLDKKAINGDHRILLTCDKVVDDSLLEYDLVAFPGGRTGALNLRNNEKLAKLMIQRNKEGKWDAAMCAAPIALGHYGLLEGANYTCYPGFEKEIEKECPNGHFSTDITVVDKEHKIITSRGPATAWAYAYTIAQTLGYDTKELEKAMLYDYLAKNINQSL